MEDWISDDVADYVSSRVSTLGVLRGVLSGIPETYAIRAEDAWVLREPAPVHEWPQNSSGTRCPAAFYYTDTAEHVPGDGVMQTARMFLETRDPLVFAAAVMHEVRRCAAPGAVDYAGFLRGNFPEQAAVESALRRRFLMDWWSPSETALPIGLRAWGHLDGCSVPEVTANAFGRYTAIVLADIMVRYDFSDHR